MALGVITRERIGPSTVESLSAAEITLRSREGTSCFIRLKVAITEMFTCEIYGRCMGDLWEIYLRLKVAITEMFTCDAA